MPPYYYLGFSVGVSTLQLARWLSERAEQRRQPPPWIQGPDLSPDMLAVARVRDREGSLMAGCMQRLRSLVWRMRPLI